MPQVVAMTFPRPDGTSKKPCWWQGSCKADPLLAHRWGTRGSVVLWLRHLWALCQDAVHALE